MIPLGPELREHLERAAHELDCCVQLAGPPLSEEFDWMERRLDKILAGDGARVTESGTRETARDSAPAERITVTEYNALEPEAQARYRPISHWTPMGLTSSPAYYRLGPPPVLAKNEGTEG